MKNRGIFVAICMVMALASCSKEPAKEDIKGTTMDLYEGSTVNLPVDGTKQSLKFKTDYKWTLDVSSMASWATATTLEGDPEGTAMTFTVSFKAEKNTTGKARETTALLKYGEESETIHIVQKILPSCSETSVTESMIFSTTLGRNTTNVAQGFDYDPDEDIVYIFQKYGAYRNHIGWQKRTTDNSTTVAANYMTLACFSHGNNIWIEKDDSGNKWVWAPNFGSREDDGSYDVPHVVSRIPLASSTSVIYNTATTENYYFGSEVGRCYPAFDFKNDIMVVCDTKKFLVYRLSELEALPIETLTMEQCITYGGVVGTINAKIPEWTGNPTIKAKDCRKVTPLYTVPFTYLQRNLHWQTYCVNDGYIYALLQADVKSAGEIMYDAYVEIYSYDGKTNKYKIRQEYLQDEAGILKYGWNTSSYFYCEPEGIKVYDDTMLVLYTMRGDVDPYLIRRPVIFRFSKPTV